MKSFAHFLTALIVIMSSQLTHAQLDTCNCIWDNSTKEYPENSKSKGFFSTTVKYNCGYICKDSTGVLQQVLGHHSASYGNEAGNEVVCDGLKYEPHNTPPGTSSNRLFVYMWDGITRAFDARNSASPTLRLWAANNCQASGTRQARFSSTFSADGVDEIREQMGLKRTQAKVAPAKYQAAELNGELQKACQLTDLQKMFARNEISAQIGGHCHEAGAKDLYRQAEVAKQSLLTTKIAENFLLTSRRFEELLMCPYTFSPSVGFFRIIQEKSLVMLTKNEITRDQFKQLSCTMALRGLPFNMMSTQAKKIMTGD
jgi:hypothetical protein